MRRPNQNPLDQQEYRVRQREFSARGQDLPQTKLLDMDVVDIRSCARQREKLREHIRSNLSNSALAKRYGVHERTVEKIIANETWSHLP